MSILLKTFSFLYLIYNIPSYSQNQENYINLIKQSDKLIGINNLSYVNGTIHTNYDITNKKENNRYLLSNDFIKGSLTYNNQQYYELLLNYDIYEDYLICIPNAENNYIKINLIKKNVNEFNLSNRKFKNLQIDLRENVFDFYEERKITNSTILYIKHSKEKNEVIQDQKIISDFKHIKKFIIYNNNNYFKINNEKDLTFVFPNKKNEINKFYKDYENLEKQNKEEFIVKLIQTINI